MVLNVGVGRLGKHQKAILKLLNGDAHTPIEIVIKITNISIIGLTKKGYIHTPFSKWYPDEHKKTNVIYKSLKLLERRGLIIPITTNFSTDGFFGGIVPHTLYYEITDEGKKIASHLK